MIGNEILFGSLPALRKDMLGFFEACQRDFGDAARDEVDVRAGLNHDGEQFAANLRVGALSSVDGAGWQPTLDGSWATALLGNWQAYVEAGAQHLIVMSAEPFALDALAELVEATRA